MPRLLGDWLGCRLAVELDAGAGAALLLGLVEAQVRLLQEHFQLFAGTLVNPSAEAQWRRALGIGYGGTALAQLVELAGARRRATCSTPTCTMVARPT